MATYVIHLLFTGRGRSVAICRIHSCCIVLNWCSQISSIRYVSLVAKSNIRKTICSINNYQKGDIKIEFVIKKITSTAN